MEGYMKSHFKSPGRSRLGCKALIPLLALALAGCSDGGSDTVVAGNGFVGDGAGNTPPPQIQSKTFTFPSFPSAGQVTLVANFQPATETSSLTAQVVAAVDQGPLAGLARMTIGKVDESSPDGTPFQPACGTADVEALTRLMGESATAGEATLKSQAVSAQQVASRQDLPEGAQQDFFLITAFRTVTGEKVLEPEETVHCTIFAELDDDGQPCISREKALMVAQAFDSNNPNRPGSGIYDQVRAAFGSEWNQNPPGGNDGDSKILLFFFRPETLGDNLYGYTSPVDESPNGGDLSNRGEIVYINAGKDDIQTLSTLAHEFQHVINQNEKAIRQGTVLADPQDENVTINEGMSQLSEEICGFDLDHGNTLLADVINDYLSRPEEHEFFDFFAAGVGYGEGYLFLKYVREQFGDETIRNIVSSPSVGKDNLDAQIPVGFDEAFRRWTVANYATNLSGNVPDIYRYPSGFHTNGSYQAGDLVGPRAFPMANNRDNSSPDLGAWSAAYLSYSGGDGSDLSLTVQTAPGSPIGVIYEPLEGSFGSFDQ
jgi:hypothetical protein